MRGVINGRIVGDINTYKGIESDSTKVKVNNEKKEIKVDVKNEFIDEKLNSKQDKLIPGENIIIDENNVISAVGGSTGDVIKAGEGIVITPESDDTKKVSIDFGIVASKENIPTNVSELYNDSGYITGITSSDVTTALGYIPYNSSNPSGYITGINSSDVITALGYTPGTSNFSGSYNDLTDKPTIPTNYVTTNTGQTISGFKTFTNINGVQSRSSATSHNYAELNGYSASKPYVAVRNTDYMYTQLSPGLIESTAKSYENYFTIKAALDGYTSNTYYNYRFLAPTVIGTNGSKIVATLDDIQTVSGTNDGTNWTSLTIGEDTYGFASGGDFNITEEDIQEEYEDSFIQAEVEVEGNNITFTNDVIRTEGNNITITADSTFGNEQAIYL